MRALHALMMLLGALAVLTVGAVPASARGDVASAPPCHETTMHHDGAGTPSPAPEKAMKTMACCVACVTMPSVLPPEQPRAIAPAPAVIAAPAALPAGERPAPEPHPPRRPVS
jgi:hypothetical protein